MKHPSGVNIPVTETSQYSRNPDTEQGTVEGKASTIYKPGKGGLNLKKGDGTDKKQYSKS